MPGSPHKTPAAQDRLEPPAKAGRAWFVVALAAVALAGGLAGATRIWDSDVPTHLACGDWMLRHGAVLDFDLFGIPQSPAGVADPALPPQPWTNVHWLFQVALAAVYRVGGWEALSALQAALTALVLVVLAISARRLAPPGWIVLCCLAAMVFMYPRVRMRPELVTLVFLACTIALVEQVRRGGSPHRLWWLVPMNLAWVNMHGLFILGPGLTWLALAGALLDRLMRRSLSDPLLKLDALAPILAATVACLVSPWPLEAATQPLLLLTRVSGQQEYYTYGVAELQPTWQVLGANWSAIAVLAATVVLAAANWRTLPAAHVLWILALTAAALLARRNVGLLGPMVGYLLAVHGGRPLLAAAGRWPRLARAGPAFACVAAAGAMALAACVVNGAIPRALSMPSEFGLGLQPYQFSLAAGRELRRLDLPGDIFCEDFGDAGAFILTGIENADRPRRLVFMDGRLEAYSLDRFVTNHSLRLALRNADSAAEAPIPPSVRFIVVNHNSRATLSALMHNPRRYRLIFVDWPCAVFAHLGGPDRQDLSALGDNLGDWDMPLRQDGLVADRPQWSPWRRNPPAPDYQIGAMLLSLGQEPEPSAPVPPTAQQQRCTLLATRYLLAAMRQGGIVDPDVVRATLAEALLRRSLQMPQRLSDVLPVDTRQAAALRLFAALDVKRVRDDDEGGRRVRMFAEYHIAALVGARQCDAAMDALKALMDNLPPREQVQAPADLVNLRNKINQAVLLSREEARLTLKLLPPVARAKALAIEPQPTADGRDVRYLGLINEALAELRGAPTPAARLLLGDLLLRKGLAHEAHAVYAAMLPADSAPAQTLTPAQALDVRERLALCDWVSGQLTQAADALAALATQSRRAIDRYFLATVLEELGQYDRARAALDNYDQDDAELEVLKAIEQTKRRLESYR